MPSTKKGPRGRTAKAAPRKSKKAAKQLPLVAKKSAKELRVERFIAEYLIHYNGRKAALAAGFSPQRARAQASEMLADPEVQEQIQLAQAVVIAARRLDREKIIGRMESIALADPRELTGLHRGACRFCWGVNHKYQRTPQELEDAKADFLREQHERQAANLPPITFNDAGGVGYNPKRDPHPECPECWGDGVARVVFNDTRDVSPDAAQLFAGIEQTQAGMKVRMHSKTEALVHLGKDLGMFAQKVKLGGDPDAPPVGMSFAGFMDEIAAEDSDTGVGPAAGRA